MDWKIFALIATPLVFCLFAQAILDAFRPNEVEEKEGERRQKRTKSVEQMADSHASAPRGTASAMQAVPANAAAQPAQSTVERQRRRRLEEADHYDEPMNFEMPADFDLAAARQL